MPPFLFSGHNIDPALTPIYRRSSVGTALNLVSHSLTINVQVAPGILAGVGNAWVISCSHVLDALQASPRSLRYEVFASSVGGGAAIPDQDGEVLMDGIQIFTFSAAAGVLTIVDTGNAPAGFEAPYPALGGMTAATPNPPTQWVNNGSPFYNGGDYSHRITSLTGTAVGTSPSGTPVVGTWYAAFGGGAFEIIGGQLAPATANNGSTSDLFGNYAGSVLFEVRDDLSLVTRGPTSFGMAINVSSL